MNHPELHCAAAVSFREGASQPEDLVDRAAELGLEAVALVDRNSLSGAPRFWKAATQAGIKPLVDRSRNHAPSGTGRGTGTERMRSPDPSGSCPTHPRRELPCPD